MPKSKRCNTIYENRQPKRRRSDINFDKIISLIDKCDKEGKNILILCAKGISRSATIMIAYVMFRDNKNHNDAYNFVKSKRSVIEPNIGFCFQLETFNTQIHNF